MGDLGQHGFYSASHYDTLALRLERSSLISYKDKNQEMKETKYSGTWGERLVK